MPNTSRICGVFGLALLLTASPALTEPKTYPDGHGGEVFFPEGDVSFADEVIYYDTGDEEPIESARNPEDALGIPDYDQANDRNFVSLGCGGELVLKFTDNILIDVPGPDLYVFEIGPDVEPTALAISGDGETWTRIGRIEGGKAEIDIAPYVQPGDEFRYVRLIDLRDSCGGRWPGADIDAVGAIGSAERIALDSSVLFATGEYQLEPAASEVITEAIADIDPDELESVVVAGHTDTVGSAESNQVLSENRANAVAQHLIERAGFDADRLTVEAWGQTRPVASNDTAEGRAQNRRVEITLRRSPSANEEQADPIEILGLWEFGRYGILEMRRENGKVLGGYDLDNGRMRGEFVSDVVYEGYWIEDTSRNRCDEEKDGSHHWGRLRMEFYSPERDEFDAKWGYCDEDEWYGEWPHGERIF